MKPLFHGMLIVLISILPVYAFAGGRVNITNGYCHSCQKYGCQHTQGLYGAHHGHVNSYNDALKQEVHHHYHGWMAGYDLRNDAAAEKLADKLLPLYRDKLDGMVNEFKADLQGKITLEFGARTTGSGAVGGGVSSDAGSDVPSTGGDGLARFKAIIEASGCSSCHSPTGNMKGFDLTDVSKLNNYQLLKSAVRVYRGTMPPPGRGKPIAQPDAEWMHEWASELP